MGQRTTSRLLFFTLLLLIPEFSIAKTMRFDLRDGLHRNLAQFLSEGSLEKIVGVSSALWGWAEVDPEDVMVGFRGELEWDLRTFETSIIARNQQIRDKVFLSSEFPVARLTFKRPLSFKKKKLASMEMVEGDVECEFNWRGATTVEKTTLKLTYGLESEKTKERLPGNLLRIQATLPIDFKKHGVEIPELWSIRFGKRAYFLLDLVGSDRSPAVNVIVLPQGDKPKESQAEAPKPAP